MDLNTNMEAMLQQMDSPAFLVQDGILVAVNQQAAARFIAVQTPIAELLITGQQEYDAFQSGSLLLKISVSGTTYACTVTCLQQYQLFTIEEDTALAELQVLSLAAQQLSMPISELSLLIDQLSETDKKSQITQNLFRLKRIIGNMSDASQLSNASARMTSCDVCAVLEEVLEKAKTLLAESQIKLTYQLPRQSVISMINAELLKRAVYNLLSNAAKFSSPGDTVDVTVKRKDNKLYLTVKGGQNTIKNTANLFHRYAREPGLESRQHGLGLGMSLIHCAASVHGGTVLIEQSDKGKLAVTMTLSIQKSTGTDVHSPILIPDIYGGNDQALIELSDVLPSKFYDRNNF